MTDPKRRLRTGQPRLDKAVDERIKFKAKSINRGASGAGKSMSNPGGTGGGTTPAPSPLAPLHSPWYEDTLDVANNSNEDFSFGLDSVITTVAVRITWRRYVGAGTDPVGMIKLSILHDGAGTATFYPEVEYGDDTAASGITLTANITSDRVQLNVAADNSGGAVRLRIAYQYEGVTAASAKGEIHIVRGTRRTQGNFGIITNGIDVRQFYKPRGPDDCGITLSGDITSGVLNLTAAADNSDTDDSAVALTVLVTGFAGIREWQRVNLSVPDNDSASENFRSDADGQIDWGAADLTIPASSSDLVTFSFDYGSVWVLLDIYRGTLVEMHEIPLWYDHTGALLQDDIWWDESAGVSFAASKSGAALVLTATTDAIVDDAILRLSYLGQAAL